MALIRGRHRQQVLVKTPADDPSFARARTHLVAATGAISRPRVTLDVDPTSLI